MCLGPHVFDVCKDVCVCACADANVNRRKSASAHAARRNAVYRSARHGTGQHSTSRQGDGTARHGMSRQDKGMARHSTARQRQGKGVAWHGTACQGTSRHVKARQGKERHGAARHGAARHGAARHGVVGGGSGLGEVVLAYVVNLWCCRLVWLWLACTTNKIWLGSVRPPTAHQPQHPTARQRARIGGGAIFCRRPPIKLH